MKRTSVLGIALLPILFLLPIITFAAPPTVAVKFVILKPSNSAVGVPTTVTIQAQKSNNQFDANYQNDVTLVTSGSATGGGLVDIVNGVGTVEVNDLVAETITLSLSDTEGTGLDISSTREVIFSAVAPGAAVWNQNKFWFRDDDGTEITATGFGAEDTNINTNITNVPRSTNFRLRFQVKVTDADGTISPLLGFREGTDCTTGDWTTVASTSSNFNLKLSENFNDGDPTTQQLVGDPNFIAGQILESTNPASALTLLKNKSTEYEWSLQVADGVALGTTYAFRVTNNGEALNNYEQCPTLTTESPPSSGGGGGGGVGVPATYLRISGKAYPGAQISLVEKSSAGDKLVRQEVAVADTGDFEITNIGIVGDTYTYSLVIKDKDGRQTQTKVYNVDLTGTGASLVIEDIFVSPTIDLARAVVTRGDFIKVIGYASPNNKVKIELDKDIIYEAKADEKGTYQLLINTARLSFGRHSIRVKQEDTVLKKESDFSLTRGFLVSSSTVPKADFSGDGKIDIKDWSIFLILWKEQKSEADLDSNGKIDISDLSIFLRAVII